MRNLAGNLQPQPGVFPDYPAPIVRHGPDGRELVIARWGMPSPAFALEGRKTDGGITNVRNTASAHWRRWLGPENRCLVPFTAFCEPDHASGSRENTWFALDQSRPLAFFAGIWTRWTSVRKLKEGEVTLDVFAFLTTEANKEVADIHPKAMPVILTHPEELDLWMSGSIHTALKLQKPLADTYLKIVARGQKSDPDPAIL